MADTARQRLAIQELREQAAWVRRLEQLGANPTTIRCSRARLSGMRHIARIIGFLAKAEAGQ